MRNFIEKIAKYFSKTGMGNYILKYRQIFIILFYILVFSISYYEAYALRFDGIIPHPYKQTLLKTVGIIVIIRFFTFLYYDLYRGLWRYVSFQDLLNIIRATTISSLIFLAFIIGFEIEIK